jgi:hypothetical protein
MRNKILKYKTTTKVTYKTKMKKEIKEIKQIAQINNEIMKKQMRKKGRMIKMLGRVIHKKIN